MRHIAAYAMLVLGGKEEPTAADVEKVVKEAGAEVDKAKCTALCEALKGKPFHDLVSEGIKPLGSMGGGSGPAAAAPAGGAAAASGGGSGLKSEKIFAMMAAYLAGGHGQALIPKVDSIFGFQITTKKGAKPSLIYEIDLKNGQGLCKEGKPAKADATFTMTDADFEAVCLGKLNPQIAFMQGKMKIAGHMGKASKFTPDLFPPPTEENMAKYAKL